MVAASVGTLYSILGIRLKSAYVGSVVKILSAGIQIQTSSETGEWRLILNPTIAGTDPFASPTSAGSQSPIEYALPTNANTVTGGEIIGNGFAESTSGGGGSGGIASKIESSRYLGAAIDGMVTRSFTFQGNGALTWGTVS